MSETVPTASAPPAVYSRPYRLYVLTLLVIGNALNMVDRQLVGVVAPLLKSEFHLSDSQLGMLGGVSFAIFYAICSIPIALLADRMSRTWIMTACLTIWSGFTALCGVAGSYSTLFLYRMGVGVGEAGWTPPAFSIMGDIFPPNERARAAGIYAWGAPIGTAAGILMGGFIAAAVGWRNAFIYIGIIGVVLAPLFKFTVREPARPEYALGSKATTFSSAMKVLGKKPTYWILSTGSGIASMLGNGTQFWLFSYFIRSYHLSLREVSVLTAVTGATAGVMGMYLGGYVLEKLTKGGPRQHITVPIIGRLISIPFMVMVFLTNSLPVAVVCLVLGGVASNTSTGPTFSLIQHLVPARMRATTMALHFMIINLIGMGGGILLVGVISDALTAMFGQEALRYSFLAMIALSLTSFAFYGWALRYVDRDWHHD